MNGLQICLKMTEFVSKKVITQQQQQQQQTPPTGRGELSVVQTTDPFSVNTTAIASYFTCLFDLWEWLTGLFFYYSGRLSEFYVSLRDFEQDCIVYTKTSKNNRLWIILSLVTLLSGLLFLLYIIIKRLRSKKNTNVSINSHSYSVYDSKYILKEEEG